MHPKLRDLTPEEIEKEYKKCKEDIAYFYENFCTVNGKKPTKYSVENMKKYINTVEFLRLEKLIFTPREKLWMMQFPLTVKEAFKDNSR